MKKLITAMLVVPAFLLASCGNSIKQDIIGTWTFSEVTFPNGKPRDITPEIEEEMKTLFKGLTYEFSDETHFTITPSEGEEPVSAVYTITDKELMLDFLSKDDKFIINELTAHKLVLEFAENRNKKDRMELVFTR